MFASTHLLFFGSFLKLTQGLFNTLKDMTFMNFLPIKPSQTLSLLIFCILGILGCDDANTSQNDLAMDATLPLDDSVEQMSDAEPQEMDAEFQELDADIPETDQQVAVEFPNQVGGNPLNPESALYPYPSDFYLKANPQTETGFEVEFPSEVLLKTMPAEAFIGQDGFSRMPMILSAWPKGVDQASLVSTSDHGESLTDQSTTLLIEHGSLRRIPHLAEVDLTVDDRQEGTLIIRPVVVLNPNQTYSVVIKSGLKDLEGQNYEANSAFQALKDGQVQGYEPLERQQVSFEQTRQVIEASGLNMDSVILAWQFHTRSQSSVNADLLRMQEQAVEWPLGRITITEERQTTENTIYKGEAEMPLYVGENGLSYDEQGQVQALGTQVYTFSMTLPKVITEASEDDFEPRPVIMFGHGFLGDHDQSTRSSFNALCRRGKFNAIGLKFGIHENLLTLLMRGIAGDVRSFYVLRAEVMQTMVNYSVMTRYVSQLSENYPALDPSRIYYMGISNGGTFGNLYAATSMLVEKAVLVVGGGGLAHFLQRATQWTTLGIFAEREYPEPWLMQAYLSQLQEQLDPIDPINYVDHLISPRFEGRLPLRAQIHMAIHDSQVHNLVSEWIARSADVPVFTPSPKWIWGLEELEAPLAPEMAQSIPSAMYVYDEMVAPYPPNNIAPSEDNNTHGTVRQLDGYQRHIIEFLDKGIIQQVCDGACDPE